MWTAASRRKTEAATERHSEFICLRVCVCVVAVVLVLVRRFLCIHTNRNISWWDTVHEPPLEAAEASIFFLPGYRNCLLLPDEEKQVH